jgi:hypothetical protein
MRSELVQWLRTKVPVQRWDQVWWQCSVLVLLAIPIGLPILRLLAILGWKGAPFAMQGLMLGSILGGPVIGSAVLCFIGEAGLPTSKVHRAKWLAGLAIIGPFLTLLMVFWLQEKIG